MSGNRRNLSSRRERDSENHIVAVNPASSNPITILYDGDGNRVSKRVGTGASAGTTKYLVDDNNPTGYAQVAEEITNGNVFRDYTYGATLISQTQLSGPNWTTSFYGFDGHGSIRFLMDSSGNVTDTYDYDAFGILIHQTGATPNLYLYSGEQFDPDLGLYYQRARYLNASTGRFWTVDAFDGDKQSPLSLHRYLYANANAINRIDPSGRESLAETAVTFAINQTIQALPLNVLFRSIQFAAAVAQGQDLGAAAEEAALGLLQDTALTFLTAGLLRYAYGALPLRAAGSTFVRAASSVWNKVGIHARGEAVENFIFQNILGRARFLHFNFPVIDDFFQGVATSIKSIDLTLPSYQNDSAILNTLSKAAGDLADFAGKRFAGDEVKGALITDRVLIVAIEDGAATVEQAKVLEQFLQNYKSIWPNIRVEIERIP